MRCVVVGYLNSIVGNVHKAHDTISCNWGGQPWDLRDHNGHIYLHSIYIGIKMEYKGYW